MNMMKQILLVVTGLALCVACEKQQTEAEKSAEIERQVQARLAAERQAQDQKELSQRVSELEAQQKAGAAEQTTVATEQASSSDEDDQDAEEAPGRGPRPEGGASYTTFYTKLEPHGVWRQTSQYGYVWQPRAAQNRGWRPYTEGRWVYTDAGWTWISEEPFGWACYHYGRWTRLRGIGWVWVPGNEWAPAWVSWRTSNDYVGWAPLPPEARFERGSGIQNWADNYYDIGPEQYSFIPTNEFGAERVERAVVPVERNVTIVNQTVNVTNITYRNKTVINQGPSYDEIRARSRRPIQRLRLDRQVSVNLNAGDPRPVVTNDAVQIPAPIIARAQAVERPRTVKETVARVEVDRGWEGIADRREMEKVRMKMKSEATPPPNAPAKRFSKASGTTAPEAAAQAAGPTPPAITPPVAASGPAAAGSPNERARKFIPPEPSATVSPAPAATPQPTMTPTPLAGATGTPLVRPSATPLLLKPSGPRPPLDSNDPRARIRDQRTDLESRRIGRPTKGKVPMVEGGPGLVTPTPTATVSPAGSVAPETAPSPGGVRGNEPMTRRDRRAERQERKEERREERKAARRGATEVLPSPSPTPAPLDR